MVMKMTVKVNVTINEEEDKKIRIIMKRAALTYSAALRFALQFGVNDALRRVEERTLPM